MEDNTNDTATRFLERARALEAAQRHSEILALAEAHDAGSLIAAEVALAKVRALVGLEQYRHALEVCDQLFESDARPELITEAALLRARALRQSSPHVDDAILAALGAATRAERAGSDSRALAAEAHAEAACLFALKRCRNLAERELAAARVALTDAPCVLAAEGQVLLAFDDRLAARACFQAATARPDCARVAWLGSAEVALLLGDFDEAHRCLDHLLPLGSDDLPARRLRARLLAAEQRWSGVASALADIAAISPSSDRASFDALEHGSALYRCGQIEEAIGVFESLVSRSSPNSKDVWAEQASRILRLLRRPGLAARPRRRLHAFPSVAQLRDYCGPAACELYLRFYGIPASQVEIAREIKLPKGTPMYRMRHYLASAGLHTRRVEADLPRIKKLIDAGVPVLMEEDYSDSRHVAVAIGYDDVREVLEVQDPMSHEVRETFYEDLPRIRDFSNDGAVVAVPADDARWMFALDDAGAVEARYISLVDEAWAASRDGRPQEGDRIAEESLQLRRDYELAWLYRYHRIQETMRGDPTPECMTALHRLADDVRSLWPEDAWPERLTGDVLLLDGRPADALAAFEKARNRDHRNPWTWCGIGNSLIALGRDQDAYLAFREALLRDPANVRSNESGAELARRINRVGLAWVLSDVARELAPENPFNHLVHGRLAAQQGDWSSAIEAYDRVLALDPAASVAAVRRANALVQLGRAGEARAFLERYDRAHPGDDDVKVEFAGLVHDEGRFVQAAAICREILTRNDGHPGANGILAASLAAVGDLETGLVTMERALLARPDYPWLSSEMGRHLMREGRYAEAIQLFAAAMASPTPHRQYDLGVALAGAGFGDRARSYLESAAKSGELGEEELVRIATCMHRARQEPHALFQSLSRERPQDLAVLCANARLQLEVYFRLDLGEPMLAEIQSRAPEHPYARAAHARQLTHDTLDAEQDAEAVLRELVAAHPRLSYPKHLLAMLLLGQDRPVEVLTLLTGTDLHFSLVRPRFLAYLCVGDFAAAEALLLAYQDGTGSPESVTVVGTLILWYYWALHRRDWEKAAKLCPELDRAEQAFGAPSCEAGLTEWSLGAFRCLLLMGDVAALNAWRLANADVAAPATFGFIACHAHDLGNLKVAAEFSRTALDRDPEDPDALQVTGRVAEVEGDLPGALALWAKGADVLPDSHIWAAQRARVALGAGDLTTALREADAAMRANDKNTLCRSLRAQARLLAGDSTGAAEDLTIAWTRSEPEWRELPVDDLAALRALFEGDRNRADELFKAYLANAVVSSLDRARVGRLMAHVPDVALIPSRPALNNIPQFAPPAGVQKRATGAIRGLVSCPMLRSHRPREPLTLAQRWVVATHATLTHQNDGSYVHLGMWLRDHRGPEWAMARLGHHWTIRGRAEALDSLQWLESAGHSADYDAFVRVVTASDREALEPGAWDSEEGRARLVFVREHAAKLGERRLRAWDYGRVAAVAGWSYLAGYIDEAEAWAWSFRAARTVQATYASWEEFGSHYLLGRVFGMGEEGNARRACEWLLSSEQSPWRQLAWLTDLGAPVPVLAVQGALP